MELREYQKQGVEILWKSLFIKPSTLCVLAPGAGKTLIMSEIIKRALERKPDFKAVLIFNRIDLAIQIADRIESYLGKKVGVYSKSVDTNLNEAITVSTIQSIHNIKLEDLNLIVLDEAHNASSTYGRFFKFIKAHQQTNPKLKIMGFTATPFRKQGYIYSKYGFFDKIDFQVDLKTLIKNDYLVIPRMKATVNEFNVKGLRIKNGEYSIKDVSKLTEESTTKIMAQINETLELTKERKKRIWCCSTIKHAHMVYNGLLLTDQDPAIVHSELTSEARARNMIKFMNDPKCKDLCFISIVAEGFDYPPIDTIVLMRPMKSPVSYLQICGRGLRKYADKEDCLIIDFGSVVKNIGSLQGPKVDQWINSFNTSVEKYDPHQDLFMCPKCRELVEYQFYVCPACGFIKPNLTDNSIEKLTEKASEEYDLIDDKPTISEWIDIIKVDISDYVSKNNNECKLITYYGKEKDYFSFQLDNVVCKEYFPINNIRFYSNFLDKVNLIKQSNCVGLQIKIKYENGFKKVYDTQIKTETK